MFMGEGEHPNSVAQSKQNSGVLSGAGTGLYLAFNGCLGEAS